MSHKPYSLNVQLGPLFTLKCVNNSGPKGDNSKFSLSPCPPSQVVQIVVGAKTSSLFANNGGGGAAGTNAYSGSTITASAPLAGMRAVTVLGTYCQPNYDSLSSYAGVTVNSMAQGATGSVIKEGLLQGGGPWIPSVPIYVYNDGVLTQSLNLPEWRRIGYAVTASQVNLDPFPFLELSSANW